MRAWPVARSIFDAPLCERSERADNKLDKPREAWRRGCVQQPRRNGSQRETTLVRVKANDLITCRARRGSFLRFPCTCACLVLTTKPHGHWGSLVGLQPTVIASRAPHLLLEQSVRFKESWTRIARQGIPGKFPRCKIAGGCAAYNNARPPVFGHPVRISS